jgi:hypothetical protein
MQIPQGDSDGGQLDSMAAGGQPSGELADALR